MMLNKRIAYLAFIAVLSAMPGQGCTAILTSDRSEMQFSTSKNPTKLVLDSVTIQVVPQNGRLFGVVGPLIPIIPFWYSEAKTRFWFLMSLSSENGEISFDPRTVALETERGDRFLAAGFSGPMLVVDALQNNSDPHRKLLDAKSLNVSVSPLSIYKEVLVGLMFDTKTLEPDKPFIMVIKGLEKEGHPIQVPPIKFKRERRRHFAVLLFDPLNFQKEWVVQ